MRGKYTTMTQEEIDKNNAIIGDFMGLEHKQMGWKVGYHWHVTIAGRDHWYRTSSMKFNSSWDWLMPVLEKIGQFEYEDGDNAYLRTFGMINPSTGNPMVRINRSILCEADTLIQAAYMAAVDFIHWHYQQKEATS
jgi:hypothetical protein